MGYLVKQGKDVIFPICWYIEKFCVVDAENVKSWGVGLARAGLARHFLSVNRAVAWRKELSRDIRHLLTVEYANTLWSMDMPSWQVKLSRDVLTSKLFSSSVMFRHRFSTVLWHMYRFSGRPSRNGKWTFFYHDKDIVESLLSSAYCSRAAGFEAKNRNMLLRGEISWLKTSPHSTFSRAIAEIEASIWSSKD